MNTSASALESFVADYWRDGFAIGRGVFTSAEMAALDDESRSLLEHRRELIDPRNLRCRFMPHHVTGAQLFEVFDPVNDLAPVCERMTRDRRILDLVEAVTREPVCLFKEKLIYKLPGAQGYNLHQDIPRYWNGFPQTFLTVLIPIDPATEENGCTEVFSGYHHEFLSPPRSPRSVHAGARHGRFESPGSFESCTGRYRRISRADASSFRAQSIE